MQRYTDSHEDVFYNVKCFPKNQMFQLKQVNYDLKSE